MREKNQVVLPIELEICIPKGDFVFKLVEICEKLDYTKLFDTYLRRWRKVNPITIFELLVYGYMTGKYSSREIENACHTDIRFMYILGTEPVPDHSTISRFQNERLTEVIEDLFYQLVMKLYELNEISFKNVFVDGTKIEANANRYTFVWKKAIEKNNEKLNQKAEVILPVIRERYGINEYVSIEECYDVLSRQAMLFSERFVYGKGHHKTQLQRDIETLGAIIDKKNEYISSLRKFNGRNSYSKTDVEATFMHLKEDHMRNGQLKAAYNIQIGVESEYIIGLGAFSNRSDVGTLIPFLKRIKGHTNRTIERVIADAGYESEENYAFLEENGQESFIKPTNYKIKKDSLNDLIYDSVNDRYICKGNRYLNFAWESTRTTDNGYQKITKHYRTDSCIGCPHKDKCYGGKADFRKIQVSQNFNEYRKKSLANITSDEGILLRMNRSIQVEGVFGVLKQDYGFRRFLTRGKKKIETQFFLLAFAFNIQKLCNRIEKNRFNMDLFPLKDTA